MPSRYLARDPYTLHEGKEHTTSPRLLVDTSHHQSNSHPREPLSKITNEQKKHHQSGHANGLKGLNQAKRNGNGNARHQHHNTFAHSNDSPSNSSGFISSFESSANSQDSTESTGLTATNKACTSSFKPKTTSNSNSCGINSTNHQDQKSKDRLKVINPKGNIFYERQDYSFISKLPKEKQNAYFIQLEDDSCTGNEDMRTFLLTQLTNNGINTIHCASCYKQLRIYDHFPIVDGLLFFSPCAHLPEAVGKRIVVRWNATSNALHQYNTSSASDKKDDSGVFKEPLIPPPGCSGPRQIQSNGDLGTSGKGGHHKRNNGLIHQERFLNALCGTCIHGDQDQDQPQKETKIHCNRCGSPFKGKNLLYGSLYTYDIFAAEPCCLERLGCKNCQKYPLSSDQVVKLKSCLSDTSQEAVNCQSEEGPHSVIEPFPFFSQYSTKFGCSECRSNDYHFVKPFYQIFTRQQD